jgi:hypothetical protein
MTYTPEHMTRWSKPDSFAQWADDWFYSSKAFVFLSQHRDSDTATRSNFQCAWEAIGGESETVQVICENHWAVGWVEWIAIHESDSKALEIADEIICALADYPILDDSHWSDLEYQEASDYWESMSISDRIYWCDRVGVSIFAARHDHLPEDQSGELISILNGV